MTFDTIGFTTTTDTIGFTTTMTSGSASGPLGDALADCDDDGLIELLGD